MADADISIGHYEMRLVRDPQPGVEGDVDFVDPEDPEDREGTIPRARWPEIVARVSRCGATPRALEIAEKLHAGEIDDMVASLERHSMAAKRASDAEESAEDLGARLAAALLDVEHLSHHRDEATRKIADMCQRHTDLEQRCAALQRQFTAAAAEAGELRADLIFARARVAELGDAAALDAATIRDLAARARELAAAETPAIALAITARVDELASDRAGH